MFQLFVLAAAILYAIAALFIKRSSELGGGAIRQLLLANLLTGILFQPLWLFPGTLHPELWYQPLVAAACFVAGQAFTFWALQKGDVSVATPVLGVKILMVSVLVTWLAGEYLSPQMWWAAGLATLGVALLNRRDAADPNRHHVGQTILISMLAGSAFAFFDVLVQKWSPAWGVGTFAPVTMGLTGLLSALLYPAMRSRFVPLNERVKPWLIAGAVTVSVQAFLMVTAIATWGKAAEANVIFSSRGLWSILFVWGFGSWFQVAETNVGSRALAWRMAGAILMTIAIVLALS